MTDSTQIKSTCDNHLILIIWEKSNILAKDNAGNTRWTREGATNYKRKLISTQSSLLSADRALRDDDISKTRTRSVINLSLRKHSRHITKGLTLQTYVTKNITKK